MPLLSPQGPSYGDLIPKELRTLNEAAMDRALLARGLAFVQVDPSRYVLLTISRMQEYLRFWPASTSSGASNFGRVLSFGVCVPFLAGGVLQALFGRDGARSRERNSEVLLTLVAASVYSAAYILTWTLVRYRLPVDAILVPFAALCMTSVSQRIMVFTRRHLE